MLIFGVLGAAGVFVDRRKASTRGSNLYLMVVRFELAALLSMFPLEVDGAANTSLASLTMAGV